MNYKKQIKKIVKFFNLRAKVKKIEVMKDKTIKIDLIFDKSLKRELHLGNTNTINKFWFRWLLIRQLIDSQSQHE